MCSVKDLEITSMANEPKLKSTLRSEKEYINVLKLPVQPFVHFPREKPEVRNE